MKPLPRVALTSFRSVVFIAGLTLLALGLTDCATRRVEKEQQVTGIPQPSATRRIEKEQRLTGIPQPDRWREFVARAAQGEIEEVSDGPEEHVITSHGVSPRGRAVPAVRARAATPSEVFSGAFRPEAKTSYLTGKTGKLAQVDTLMRSLPTDMQMTQMHPELITKDKNHQNHEPRIDLETRNVTVKAWLYWVGHQADNDFHLVLGDTSELTSTTVFMNSEVSRASTNTTNSTTLYGFATEAEAVDFRQRKQEWRVCYTRPSAN